MPAQLYITYPEMKVLAITKLIIISSSAVPCLGFVQRCASSSHFFIRLGLLQMSDVLQIFIFPKLFSAPPI